MKRVVSRDQRSNAVLGLCGALAAAALVVAALVSTDAGEPSHRAVGVPNPTPGKEVPVSEVEALTRQHTGPLLPQTGEYVQGAVERAWVDDYGAFGLQFESGLWIIMQEDQRTQEEAEATIKGQIDADTKTLGFSQFSIEEVRGTLALAHETGEDGPSSLQWLEGRVWIQVIGLGGESLSEVRELVTAMPASSSSS